MGSPRVDATEQLTTTTIIIVGEFNTLLTSMDRSFRLKINKAIEVLNDTVEQLDLIDTYRAPHPNKNILFSNMRGTLSKTGHTAGHKISLNKFKSVKIISSIFSNHKTMKLEISYKKEKYKKNKHVETKQHANKKPNQSVQSLSRVRLFVTP